MVKEQVKFKVFRNFPDDVERDVNNWLETLEYRIKIIHQSMLYDTMLTVSFWYKEKKVKPQ